MKEQSDAQLLRDYAERHDEAAFTELVTRHTDLVYSAALRQADSPDLARDVAQSVFSDLARKAGAVAAQMTESGSLVGWLYRSTRFAALNQLRGDRRRLTYERQAMEHLISNSEPAPNWEGLRPLIDESMAGLGEEDRDAVLLRFFKGYDFKGVGLALGVSDDAAQKRVSRAVERLREELVRRGLTTSAAGLCATVAAHAVQAAPAGLATTIASAALAAGTTLTTAVTATKAIATTMLQKTAITVTIAAALGTGLYEARQASALRATVDSLTQQQAPMAEQVRQLTTEQEDAAHRFAALRAENEQLRRDSEELLKLRAEIGQMKQGSIELAKLKAELAEDQTLYNAVSWKDRVERLKQRLQQTPESNIPELQLLTETDWLDAAKDKLDSDSDFRRALSALRNAGESKLVPRLRGALKAYQEANNGQMPSEIGQLSQYFDPPIDEALLQRWEVAPAKTIKSLGLGSDVIITQKSAVDDVFDTRFGIGPHGSGTTDFLSSETGETMNPVWKAFLAANNGRYPDDVSKLLPYATTPEQIGAVQKLILRQNSASK
ncbi:MAG TPA: sigma-70 family RNA polymerase sigma factor [Candidatus Acidoferrum sp.]|nr:sigma-70 family RNA polymerase sigma factor [Candidatus Acidoferrum sp.]